LNSDIAGAEMWCMGHCCSILRKGMEP